MRNTEILAGKRDKSICGNGNRLAGDMVQYDIKE